MDLRKVRYSELYSCIDNEYLYDGEQLQRKFIEKFGDDSSITIDKIIDIFYHNEKHKLKPIYLIEIIDDTDDNCELKYVPLREYDCLMVSIFMLFIEKYTLSKNIKSFINAFVFQNEDIGDINILEVGIV